MLPPMATFQTSREGPINILAVSGRLDPADGTDLRQTIESLTRDADAPSLLVDLEHLEYMASAGFRELFMAGRKISRAGGHLAVCALRGEVQRIFNLAKFDTAYPIHPDRATALAAMAPPPPTG
jgi:anti-anti-sigma factor